MPLLQTVLNQKFNKSVHMSQHTPV